MSTLPYSFINGHAVVYNDEIHILGGSYAETSHYKYDGNTWTEVSTLPIELTEGSAVVWNNEIYIFVRDTHEYYKYNGDTWSEAGTIPFVYTETNIGLAVVYDNELHLFSHSHQWKLNGSEWVELDEALDLPYQMVEYKNKLYAWLFKNTICCYDGSVWTNWGVMPDGYTYQNAAAFVYNNKLHVLGGNGYGDDPDFKHFEYDGHSWARLNDLPYGFQQGCVVVYNNEIHMLGGWRKESCHYKAVPASV